MKPTSTESIVPGLLKRSLLRFERTAFHALAELLEDLGALAYHRYAVLDERCTWRDARFDDQPAPRAHGEACRRHTNGGLANGEVPASPGGAPPPAGSAPNHVEGPRDTAAAPESHVACRGGGHATCRQSKACFGRPLFGACPHYEAHFGLSLSGACLRRCHRG